jgi:hypothetical protein
MQKTRQVTSAVPAAARPVQVRLSRRPPQRRPRNRRTTAPRAVRARRGHERLLRVLGAAAASMTAARWCAQPSSAACWASPCHSQPCPAHLRRALPAAAPDAPARARGPPVEALSPPARGAKTGSPPNSGAGRPVPQPTVARSAGQGGAGAASEKTLSKLSEALFSTIWSEAGTPWRIQASRLPAFCVVCVAFA